MKLYIQVLGTDRFFSAGWPDHLRVPCVGEQIFMGHDMPIRVESVQWEIGFDQTEPWQVQLRCAAS
jgi:hypothetical protein